MAAASRGRLRTTPPKAPFDVPEELRRNQHLVSKGYQRNFADGEVVTILDPRTGQVIWPRRNIKTNWRAVDFLSVIRADGVDDSLERDFDRMEGMFLRAVRQIRLHEALTADQKEALDALAATHLVRSRAFHDAHDRVVKSTLQRGWPGLAERDDAVQVFIRDRGRPPEPGELEALVAAVGREFASSPDLFPNGVRNTGAGIHEQLGKWTVQLAGSAENLPGFILPDHPVVHGSRAKGRFGFRDAGAIGDADVVAVPISRRLVAFYTGEAVPDVQISTKTQMRWFNALLLHGADREVACHPDDKLETARLVRARDRYPPERFGTHALRSWVRGRKP